MNITIESKDRNKALRWLGKAKSKDEARPAMTMYHRKGDALWATDGFRLHAVPAHDLVPDGTTFDVNIPAAATEITLPAEICEDHTYPDVHRIVQQCKDQESKAMCLGLNARYLSEALALADGVVRIEVTDHKSPITIRGMDKKGNPIYAVLMPAKVPEKGWTPG